jgi:uncharacterized RmlC-like cupin family protein
VKDKGDFGKIMCAGANVRHLAHMKKSIAAKHYYFAQQAMQDRLLDRRYPTKPGLYAMRLRIPPNTKTLAHSHKDDRTAVVLSGVWYFGYGAS